MGVGVMNAPRFVAIQIGSDRVARKKVARPIEWLAVELLPQTSPNWTKGGLCVCQADRELADLVEASAAAAEIAECTRSLGQAEPEGTGPRDVRRCSL